jgi:glycerophosphoryl diester phosphodiesterase
MRIFFCFTLLLLAPVVRAEPGTIVAIAHRGEHLHHPENTMPAFEEAVRVGGDFIEVDVRTTAGGKLVLMHGATVDRTTNGHGEVSKLTFDEIRKLDAGVKTGFRAFRTSRGLFDLFP